MHAGAVDAEDRFRHEGGMQVVFCGDRLDNPLEGDGVVGGSQGIGILEVDLVLTFGDLVVRGLDLETHLLEGLDDLATAVIGLIFRIEREIAGDIVGNGGRQPVFIAARRGRIHTRCRHSSYTRAPWPRPAPASG